MKKRTINILLKIEITYRDEAALVEEQGGPLFAQGDLWNV